MVKDCNRQLRGYPHTDEKLLRGLEQKKNIEHFQFSLLACEGVTTFQHLVTYSYWLKEELEIKSFLLLYDVY